MIISVAALKSMQTFLNIPDSELERKVRSLEAKIRKVTHNNFQNKAFRFVASVTDGKLLCDNPYVSQGDTLQISETDINDGLINVKGIENGFIISDKQLYDCEHALVTKIVYPDDIVEGCIGLLKYDIERGDKAGIQSETISRHSVTYFDVSARNQFVGYPVSLTAFLKPYMKARF